jgi:hypothetical protein
MEVNGSQAFLLSDYFRVTNHFWKKTIFKE